MKRKGLTLSQKRSITGLIFIFPWLMGFLVYYLGSLIQTISFSLSKIEFAETGGYTSTFIGLQNFRFALFEHAEFNQILVNSLVDILIDVPFIIFFSLFIAILLNSRFKGRSLIRAIYFLPILLGSGAVAETLQLATQNIQGGATAMVQEMTPATGVNIDALFDVFLELGLPIRLMDYVEGLLSRIYEIVRASSIQIVIFLAALQSISPALYEVSKIEGATTYETFWKITFPMVSPLILTNVVYTIVDSFVNSEVVEMAFETAFTDYNYGLSSAMSVLSTVLVCIVLSVICVMISKKTFYHN